MYSELDGFILFNHKFKKSIYNKNNTSYRPNTICTHQGLYLFLNSLNKNIMQVYIDNPMIFPHPDLAYRCEDISYIETLKHTYFAQISKSYNNEITYSDDICNIILGIQ